jgi:phage terminase large subunit-like protein
MKAANPALGDFLNEREVREQAEAARRMPARESAYRNLVLNQRVNQLNPLISPSVWKGCGNAPQEEAFRNSKIRIGLDLSARHDLTALVYRATCGGVHHVRAEFFVPADGLVDRSVRDRVPYDVWAQQGLITTTPGASVDYEYVARRLCELCDDYDVEAIAFDRWRIDVLKAELTRLNVELPLIPHGQGYKDMSPAIETLEGELLNGRIRHGMNPVLTMCAANAVADSDPAGNRKLNKAKSTGRIDGMVALAMAIGAEVRESEPQYQVFVV